jgi:hypothetical protein
MKRKDSKKMRSRVRVRGQLLPVQPEPGTGEDEGHTKPQRPDQQRRPTAEGGRGGKLTWSPRGQRREERKGDGRGIEDSGTGGGATARSSEFEKMKTDSGEVTRGSCER